jgi:uncharacterized protein YndB with AHSA1/START domain
MAEKWIAATPSQMLYAFTHENGLREWLTNACVAEAKPNGRFYFTINTMNNPSYASAGTFTTFTPERLVLAWQGTDEAATQVTVTLTADGAGTRVRVESAAATAVDWEDMLTVLETAYRDGYDLRIARVPMVGITPQRLDADLIAKHGFPVDAGIFLTNVLAEMGAHAAGLQAHDLLVSIDQHAVSDLPSLQFALRGKYGGDTVQVGFYRAATLHNVSMTLTKRATPPCPTDLAEGVAQATALYESYRHEFSTIFDGVSDAQAFQAPTAGEWSAAEVVAHLLLTERNTQEWLGSLTDQPELATFSGAAPNRVAALTKRFTTIADLLAAIYSAMHESLDQLRDLPPELYTRKPAFYRSVRALMDSHHHFDEHFAQIRAALAVAATAEKVR